MNAMIPKFLVMVGSEEDPNHFCVSQELGIDDAIAEYEEACQDREPGEIVRMVLIEKELKVGEEKNVGTLFVELKPQVGQSIQYEVIPGGDYEYFYIARDPQSQAAQCVYVLPKTEYQITKIIKKGQTYGL